MRALDEFASWPRKNLWRDSRWSRPFLETLAPRLAPGDTLLGLLLPSGLFDAASADSSFILHPSSFARVVGALEHEALDDQPRLVRVLRGFEDSAPAKLVSDELARWPTSQSGWPGGLVAANAHRSTGFAIPTGQVANLSETTTFAHGVTGRATTQLNPIPPGLGAGLGAMLTRPNPAMAVTAESVGRVSMSAAASGNYGSLPFYFEQNVGQAGDGMDFVARGSGYTLGVSATEAVMAFEGSGARGQESAFQNSEFRIQNSEWNTTHHSPADHSPLTRRPLTTHHSPTPHATRRRQLCVLCGWFGPARHACQLLPR
jgi:hypothetical protein